MYNKYRISFAIIGGAFRDDADLIDDAVRWEELPDLESKTCAAFLMSTK